MMGRLALISGVALLVATALAASGTSAPASPSASRIIDRTFLCANASQFGVRKIAVGDVAGFRDAGKWTQLASAGIGNSGEQVTNLPRGTTNANWGVGVAAGAGPIDNDPNRPKAEAHLIIWSKMARLCKAVPGSRVPLSAHGLTGGAAGPLGDDFTCPAARRAYVRVRAVFRSPVTLQLDRSTGYLKARGPMREAYVAARTESGKPLAFASVFESGKARLFTARGCATD
jgi:hypothetical protein